MRLDHSTNWYSSKPHINVVLFSMFFYDRDSGDVMSREAPSTVPLLKPQKEPEWFIVCHRCLKVSRGSVVRSNGVTILCAWMLWKRLEVTVTLGWWTWPNTTRASWAERFHSRLIVGRFVIRSRRWLAQFGLHFSWFAHSFRLNAIKYLNPGHDIFLPSYFQLTVHCHSFDILYLLHCLIITTH